MAGDRQRRIMDVLASLNPANEENRRAFVEGFQHDYQIGRDDTQQVFYRKRELQELQKEAPRLNSLLGNHPGITRLKELTGTISPEHQRALLEADMHLDKNAPLARQLGQLGGTVAADLTQDSTRSAWWLINALQASGEIVNEQMLAEFVPELWQHTPVRSNTRSFTDTKAGKQKRYLEKGDDNDYDEMIARGLLTNVDGKDVPKRGMKFVTADIPNGIGGTKKAEILKERNYSPGMLAALAIPTGLAINNGLGLMTPFGGAEGFKANNPSPEDPTKTNNVIAEVAQKYILGKTGGLLPYDEFKKVRPDVSKSEYAAYQANKFDNTEDWNPFDGDISVLGGAIKANNEGILGPEVSMLGRSLPVSTGVVPFVTAMVGTTGGAYYGHHYRNRKGAQTGLIGGLAGTTLGTIGGSIIENERRRRNVHREWRASVMRFAGDKLGGGFAALGSQAGPDFGGMSASNVELRGKKGKLAAFESQTHQYGLKSVADVQI